MEPCHDVATPIHKKFDNLHISDKDAIADDPIACDVPPHGVEVHTPLITDLMYAKGYLKTFASSCLAEVNARAKLHLKKMKPLPPPPSQPSFNQRISEIHNREFSKMKPILSHYLVHHERELDLKRRKTVKGKETTKTTNITTRSPEKRRLPTSKGLFNLNAALLPPAADFARPQSPHRRVSLLELAGVKPPQMHNQAQFSFSSPTVPTTTNINSLPIAYSMLPPKRPSRIPSPSSHTHTQAQSHCQTQSHASSRLLPASEASRIPRLSPIKPSLTTTTDTPSRLPKLSLARMLSAPAAPAPHIPSLRLDRTLRKYTVPQELSLYARPTISSSNKSLRNVSK